MSLNVLELLKSTIGQVKGEDFSDTPTSSPLDLDSINRITLIAEMENVFNINISDMDIEPETFESIDSLSSFVKGVIK
ncbi:hypothetical protein DXV75_05590 [Alteromonas aestuariivivens]|uniref:Carrier domain-containing protein n=1 Tax=Alteromonas aestuariivivens TaxID=1938339 RepID=A0A3D8MBY7_9ALTE|nr:phosphopantetheine-binding protein [Alteromonas aestuariivivens]RDV27499.1 hypothetical protein DXV75_05590 [Alteromonas aestuariivivens]